MRFGSSAVLSPCGSYRFELRRASVSGEGNGTVTWVMLNPSTADADTDDPTIRRVMAFTERWGYEKAIVVNLYPMRSRNPLDALHMYARPPIGGEYFENLRYVDRAVREADLVVAAWGAHGYEGTGDLMRENLQSLRDDVKCLGVTKTLQPRHPLYLPLNTLLVPLPN